MKIFKHFQTFKILFENYKTDALTVWLHKIEISQTRKFATVCSSKESSEQSSVFVKHCFSETKFQKKEELERKYCNGFLLANENLQFIKKFCSAQETRTTLFLAALNLSDQRGNPQTSSLTRKSRKSLSTSVR